MPEITSLQTCASPDQINIPGLGCTKKDYVTYAAIGGLIYFILTRH